jgi:hypothetical protein
MTDTRLHHRAVASDVVVPPSTTRREAEPPCVAHRLHSGARPPIAFGYRRRELTAGIIVAVVLVAGACSGGDERATPPPASPPVRATAFSAPVQDKVRADYLAFWEASERSTRMPPEQIQAALLSTGWYRTFQVRQIRAMQSRHQEPWGEVVHHIGAIQVTGGRARVPDCQDASAAGLANNRTHALIEDTRGPKKRNLIASLILGRDGRWRVDGLKQFRKPC